MKRKYLRLAAVAPLALLLVATSGYSANAAEDTDLTEDAERPPTGKVPVTVSGRGTEVLTPNYVPFGGFTEYRLGIGDAMFRAYQRWSSVFDDPDNNRIPSANERKAIAGDRMLPFVERETIGDLKRAVETYDREAWHQQIPKGWQYALGRSMGAILNPVAVLVLLATLPVVFWAAGSVRSLYVREGSNTESPRRTAMNNAPSPLAPYTARPALIAGAFCFAFAFVVVAVVAEDGPRRIGGRGSFFGWVYDLPPGEWAVAILAAVIAAPLGMLYMPDHMSTFRWRLAVASSALAFPVLWGLSGTLLTPAVILFPAVCVAAFSWVNGARHAAD